MGSLSRTRIITILVCLFLTVVTLNIKSSINLKKGNSTLSATVLPSMAPWLNQGNVSLSENIVNALELDDYLYNSFSNGKDKVSLYVGYYFSQKKIGAAHSPLVCFPGQGWDMSDIDNFSLQVGDEIINLASVIITKGEEKQLVLYWFQAVDKTSAGTLMQKINLLRTKLLSSREENAFVRVIIPFGEGKSLSEANNVGIQFIRHFYPIFKKFILAG